MPSAQVQVNPSHTATTIGSNEREDKAIVTDSSCVNPLKRSFADVEQPEKLTRNTSSDSNTQSTAEQRAQRTSPANVFQNFNGQHQVFYSIQQGGTSYNSNA